MRCLRAHIQFLSGFGILFGANIVPGPLCSKELGTKFDPNKIANVQRNFWGCVDAAYVNKWDLELNVSNARVLSNQKKKSHSAAKRLNWTETKRHSWCRCWYLRQSLMMRTYVHRIYIRGFGAGSRAITEGKQRWARSLLCRYCLLAAGCLSMWPSSKPYLPCAQMSSWSVAF